MSRPAFSVFVFAIYLYVLGLVLVIVPNSLLALFRLPETTEVWIRVVGVLVVLIGFYYTTAARNELTAMFRASVIARLSVLVFFVAFAVVGFAPPVLVVFGLVDAAAAIWTGWELRNAGASLA
ncbi:MAG: hypothetical protein PVG53_12500 [Holophagae bacterium]|jgi:hypothetical protein